MLPWCPAVPLQDKTPALPSYASKPVASAEGQARHLTRNKAHLCGGSFKRGIVLCRLAGDTPTPKLAASSAALAAFAML